MSLTDPGTHELVKASVHGALWGLAAICTGYNGLAFYRRGETHLAVNTVFYTAVLAWEVKKILHHLR